VIFKRMSNSPVHWQRKENKITTSINANDTSDKEDSDIWCQL